MNPSKKKNSIWRKFINTAAIRLVWRKGADSKFDSYTVWPDRFTLFAFIPSLLLVVGVFYVTVSFDIVDQQDRYWVYWALGLNMALIMFFLFRLWADFSRIIKFSAKTNSGSALHFRYVRLFVLAAVIPAIIIAIFSVLTIGRGVQSWLGGPVKESIAATSNFSEETVRQIIKPVQDDISAMALDLDSVAQEAKSNPERFIDYLAIQTSRRGFAAAYLLDRKGEILSSAVRPEGAPSLLIPSDQAFDTADSGQPYMNLDKNFVARALIKLSAFKNTYLEVVRVTNKEQVNLINNSNLVIGRYQALADQQARVGSIFAFAYLQAVLLIAIAAAWLGLRFATRIANPISNLAFAAEKIHAGDLSVRVPDIAQSKEFAELSRTFNRMAAEVSQQRKALQDARAQAELRSDYISAVLEGVSAGVISLDSSLKVLAVNNSASNLLGVKAEDIMREGIEKIAPDFLPILEKAETEITVKTQKEVNVGDSSFLFDITATRVGQDFVITFDDVSSLLAAQRQAAWKDVARRIAHEIKNPLTPIQLSAERLARKFSKEISGDRETFVKMTDTIIRQVSDIGRMVDEFSSFARMPALRIAEDDICEVVRQSVFSQKITNSEIEYHLSCPPEPIKIAMDSRLIEQAISNLLKNAAEAIGQYIADNETESGFMAKIITSLDVKGRQVEIEITDNGKGLPQKDRQKLLEPYVTTRTKGTGLGLAIVARVIEEHGGKLVLGDREDKERGACVKIILPFGENIDSNNSV